MSRSVQFGRPDGDHLAAHRDAVDRGDAGQLRVLGGAVAGADRVLPDPGQALPPARPEGLHHGGGDVLPDQLDAHRDRRGRAHGRGAAAAERGGSGSARRHRGVGAGRALHDDAAQPAVRRHRHRFQHPARRDRARGAYGYAQGWVTLGQITTAVLYVQALSGPLDRLVGELDRLQVGSGVDHPPARHRRGPAGPESPATGGRPAPSWSAATCGSPTGRATTCCTASTSSSRRGSGWRSSGPSGSGKSTLGRLLSGINRAADRRGHGGRRRPGRPAAGGAAHRGRPGHPGAPRVRRDGPGQHRAGPRGLRRRGVSGRRCAAVGRADWVERLPQRPRHACSAPAASALTPAQAQQVALARLIVADPHTLVLDEATSLIDPRTARHLEGSMAALLRRPDGRRHRPPAAHRPRRRPDRGGDRRPHRRARQPRRAGRADGEYAALWQVWTS